MTSPWPAPPGLPANAVPDDPTPARWTNLGAAVLAIGVLLVMVVRLLQVAAEDRRAPEVEALYELAAAFALIVVVPLSFVALAAAICLLLASRAGFVLNVVFGGLMAVPTIYAVDGGWWWTSAAPLVTLGAGIWGLTTDELKH